MANASEQYNNYFIEPADPLRYAIETRGIPRVRDLRQVNTVADIERGWRPAVIPTMWREFKIVKDNMLPFTFAKFFGEKENRTATAEEYLGLKYNGLDLFYRERVSEYPRLTDRIKYHFLRTAKSNNSKLKWYLPQFAPEAPMGFFQFDIDVRSIEDEIKAQITIDKINATVAKLGGTVVWTRSPGDIYNGKHLQGYYAWIRLSEFCVNSRLIENKHAIKEFFGISCEASFDAKFRNIRLLGQQGVELCDPKTGELLHPVGDNEPQRKAFDAACDAWTEAKTIDINDILPEKMIEPVKVKPVKPAKVKMVNPVKAKAVSKIGSENAYTRMNNITAMFTRTVQGNVDRRQEIETLIDVEFQRQSMLGQWTDHTSHPLRQKALRDRCLTHHIDSYDASKASKCSNKNTVFDRTNRNEKDMKRWSYQKDVDIHYILQAMPYLSDREQDIIKQFWAMQNKYQGRVSVTTIYDNRDSIICSKKEWFTILEKTGTKKTGSRRWYSENGDIVVLDEYSVERSRCRQYGFSWKVIEKAKRLQALDAERTEERERIRHHYRTTTTTHQNTSNTVFGRCRIEPHQTGKTPLSLDFESLVSTLSDHFSSDVYENQEPARI